ncbi:hypothetical protein EC919_107162 [Pseudomonas graminis]|uniref:hypothetical protein n=1 Tax=Pseudomonas graminis TaxID=158627 RepID=UPI00105C5AAC|nr:hypothetical protein [Pseudomonas graminis]TDV50143.1 hypothetical protein EC919_107162 [Pseudomonas graminis]
MLTVLPPFFDHSRHKLYAPFAPYLITTQEGERFPGVTDKDGRTIPVHTLLPGNVVIELPNDKPDEQ